MTGLQHLDNNLKDLIDRIITEYHLDFRNMENDIEGITYGPGIYFNNVFSDDYTKIYFAAKDNHVTINIDSSKLICNYKDTDINERKSFEVNNSALIHAKFIESVHFIKWMYENNLIYLTREDRNLKDISQPQNSHYKPLYSDINWSICSDTISEFILAHYNSRIIPSPYLISFYNNGFKTQEQIQYEKQLAISTKALKRAKIGNWIAIGVAIATVVISTFVSLHCAYKVPTSIQEEQHKELIETIKTQYNGQTTNEKR